MIDRASMSLLGGSGGFWDSKAWAAPRLKEMEMFALEKLESPI